MKTLQEKINKYAESGRLNGPRITTR